MVCCYCEIRTLAQYSHSVRASSTSAHVHIRLLDHVTRCLLTYATFFRFARIASITRFTRIIRIARFTRIIRIARLTRIIRIARCICSVFMAELSPVSCCLVEQYTIQITFKKHNLQKRGSYCQYYLK